MLQLAQNSGKKLFLFCLCLFGSIAVTLAQTPIFIKAGLKFELSQNTVNGIYKDSTGLMWLCTNEKLALWDGMTIKEIKATNTLEKNNFTCVAQANVNKYWAGTSTGKIGLIENSSLRFCFFEEGCPKKSISSIAVGSNDIPFFATRGEGVYFYWNKRLYNINEADGLPDNYCYKVLLDKLNRLWVATDNGIAIFNVEKGKKKLVKRLNVKEGLSDNIVKDIVILNESVIVAGMQEKGVCNININNFSVSAPEKYNAWAYGEINKLCVLKNEIWIATSQQGIIYDNRLGPLKQFTKYKDLIFNRINDITTDEQNNLWIAYSDGVLRSTGSKLQWLTSIRAGDIMSVHQLLITKKQQLIFTPDQGLVLLPLDNLDNAIPKKHEVTPAQELVDIVSLCEDECGNIWIGTTGRGIFKLDSTLLKISKAEAPDLINNATVLSIKIHNDELWIAWLGGVSKYKMQGYCNTQDLKLIKENFDPYRKLGDYYVYTVFNDSRNRTWVGTDGKGLLKIENNNFTFYTINDGLKSNIVYSIVEEKNGRIWFSTSGKGLHYFEDGTIHTFDELNGLSEGVTSAMAVADNGRLIAVNENGIDLIIPGNKSVVNYGNEWELNNLNIDLNAIAVSNNTFYLGAENGILIYNSSIEPVQSFPKTIIENVMLPFKNTEQRTFKHDENNITFSIASTWPANAESISFQYILEGYSKEWNTTRDRKINFPSLSPGNYLLKVRSSTNQQFTNSPVAQYEFVISKPFWKEVWFIALSALAFTSLLLYYLKMREENNRKYNALRNEKILFQFETLRNQVNPHFLFNSFNTLISIIEEDKDAAIEYVQKLSDFFRDVVSNKDKNIISLKEELELAETYFYLQKKRFGNNLTLEISIEPAAMKKALPSMVLQLLIENSIKHNAISGETPLQIEIKSSDNRLEVSNNKNEKRTKDPSTGLGLNNIINRYRLQTAETVIVRETEELFSVSIPLLNNEL